MRNDLILTALEEAAVEVRFRLEDVKRAQRRLLRTHPHQEDSYPIVQKSVASSLKKIRTAIAERKQELSWQHEVALQVVAAHLSRQAPDDLGLPSDTEASS